MTTTRTRRHAVRIPALLAAVVLALGVPGAVGPAFAPQASAVPATGANSNTPGTNSEIGPSVLAPGETLSWSVSGFPAGVPVYVKIDDGSACPATAAQGACVITSSMVAADGTAGGSFALPSSLEEGMHWLRFLATGPAPERLGYSHRSGDFEVTSEVTGGGADVSGPVDNGDGGGGGAVDTGGDGGGAVDEQYEENWDDGTGAAPAQSGGGGGAAPQAAAPAGAGAGAPAGGAVAAPVRAGAGGSGAATAAGSRAAGDRRATAGSTRGGAVRAASAPGASSATAGGLTPYENVTLAARSESESKVPWIGLISMCVALLLALAMLGAAVAVTRPELVDRRRAR